MNKVYFERRLDALRLRLNALAPSTERARQAVWRLEREQVEVPAGTISGALAAQLSAARAMATTLEERERQVRVAIAALQAELMADPS
ncbi:hypothetical protein [Candidatus Chloroploca sp. Khr17]|uniref:hypothetical protein n=1 Tax=Candidatus Chloroploca sp. Khr17 TaxID=2496869 RepID=UPI00101BA35B|nr:hypothetical protein [Candidatus Chloroploca sp. Khr17]